MSQTVYVVERSGGSYDDTWEYPITAFSSEECAQAFVKRAKREATRLYMALKKHEVSPFAYAAAREGLTFFGLEDKMAKARNLIADGSLPDGPSLDSEIDRYALMDLPHLDYDYYPVELDPKELLERLQEELPSNP